MQTNKKQSSGLACLAAKTILIGAVGLTVAGCVAETSPRGAYGTGYYAAPPTTTTVVTEPGTNTTVVVHDHPTYYEQQAYPDYDNKWDYGRIGNGNFHGTGDDDVHDY